MIDSVMYANFAMYANFETLANVFILMLFICLFTAWVTSLTNNKPTPEGVRNFFLSTPSCKNNIRYSDIISEYISIYDTKDLFSSSGLYFSNKILNITKTKNVNVIIDRTNNHFADFSVKLKQYSHNNETSYYDKYICKVSVESPIQLLSLQSLRIKTLEIDLSIFKGDIIINNCLVSELKFINKAPDQYGIGLVIWNSYVKHVDLRNVFFKSLDIISSYVYSFSFPASKDDNPFKGDVELIDSEILPERLTMGSYNVGGEIQSINNIIFYLEENRNFKAASYIKGYLKRATRINRKRYDCEYIVDFLFDSVSFYNILPERILGIILCFFVIICSSIFTFDLSVINGQVQNYDVISKLSRSILLTFSSIFYPVGLWSQKSFVTTSSSLVRVVLAFYGLINYIMFALFIIGLRKKYQQ